MNYKLISQILVFVLMVDATVVYVGLLRKENMWAFIVLYWLILTVKNAVDFAGM